jgi:hypothetical protein
VVLIGAIGWKRSVGARSSSPPGNPEVGGASDGDAFGTLERNGRGAIRRHLDVAFQWVLDRLGVLGIIAWVREPHAIHMTVSEEVKVLLPLLERLPE